MEKQGVDKIIIEAIEIESVVGVYPHEREHPTSLLVDIEVVVDTRAAAISDDLVDTLDYAAVVDQVRTIAAATQFYLLEALVQRMADAVLEHSLAQCVKISVKKPRILSGCGAVGVQIERYSLQHPET